MSNEQQIIDRLDSMKLFGAADALRRLLEENDSLRMERKALLDQLQELKKESNLDEIRRKWQERKEQYE
jgi:regulator of replication initiation timing